MSPAETPSEAPEARDTAATPARRRPRAWQLWAGVAALCAAGAGVLGGVGAAQVGGPALGSAVSLEVEPGLSDELTQHNVDRILAASPVMAAEPLRIKVTGAEPSADQQRREFTDADVYVFWRGRDASEPVKIRASTRLSASARGAAIGAERPATVNRELGQGPAALTFALQESFTQAARREDHSVQSFTTAGGLGLAAVALAGIAVGARRRVPKPQPELSAVAQRARLSTEDDPDALRPALVGLLLRTAKVLATRGADLGAATARARDLAELAQASPHGELPVPPSAVDSLARTIAALAEGSQTKRSPTKDSPAEGTPADGAELLHPAARPVPRTAPLTAAAVALASSLDALEGSTATPPADSSVKPSARAQRLHATSAGARLSRGLGGALWRVALCGGIAAAAAVWATTPIFRAFLPPQPPSVAPVSVELSGPGVEELRDQMGPELAKARTAGRLHLRLLAVAPPPELTAARAKDPASSSVPLSPAVRQRAVDAAMSQLGHDAAPAWTGPVIPAGLNRAPVPQTERTVTVVHTRLANGDSVLLGTRSSTPSACSNITWDRLLPSSQVPGVVSAKDTPAELVKAMDRAAFAGWSELRVPSTVRMADATAIASVTGGMGTAAILSWAWALWPRRNGPQESRG